MSKNCCIGDANVSPKSSSCSMVLRSACSHRHSRESSTAKEHFNLSSPRKRKDLSVSKESCKDNLHLQSCLELSLKQLTLKSAVETYSLLTGGPIYKSFELSDSASQKVIETDCSNGSCAKECHFSQISALNNSSFYEKNISNKESRSDYSSATDMSESIDSNSNMSRIHRVTRNSARTFSSSEDDEISVHSIVRSRASITRSSTNFTTPTRPPSLFSQESNSHTNNNNNFNGERYTRFPGGLDDDNLSKYSESSYQDRSTVQNSLFHRFRWFIWKCIYLKIIQMVSLDVWFLTRLHKWGTSKVVFLLCLPVLFCFIWGFYTNHQLFTSESVSQTNESIISSVYESIISSIFSTSSVISHKEEEVEVSDTDPDSESSWTFFDVFKISGWFEREESNSLKSENDQSTESINHQTEEVESIHYQTDEGKSIHYQTDEVKSIHYQTDVLKNEISALRGFLKTSTQTAELEKEKLQMEIRNLQNELLSLSRIVEELKIKQSENEMKDDVIALNKKYKDEIEHINIKLSATKTSISERINACCNNQWSEKDILELLEKHLILAFKKVVGSESDQNSKYYFFNEWLSTKFFSHEQLVQEINIALRQQSFSDKKVNHDDVIKIVESTVLKYTDDMKSNLSEMNKLSYASFSTDDFSEDKIRRIVKEAIMLYDADKTGQVDYALESGGGSVLGTRCSETYSEQYGKLSIFGLPLWTNLNSPRTAIQPDMQPGRCWAFKGSQGFLVIELSATIYPTGFTLEHIPVALSPAGSIDSAPKNFSVWGLDSETDNKGTLLGQYWYDISKEPEEPLQHFIVQKPDETKPYSFIELQIHSNHGNINYTCLYRFRVHGKRVR